MPEVAQARADAASGSEYASMGILDTEEADPALPFRWRIVYAHIAAQNQWWHEMERLNYFSPYQDKGAWHEDQLTRAFLVVVRIVPLALSGFLDLIRDEQASRGSAVKLPSSTELLANGFEIETQKNSIAQNTGRLISVVMTDEDWKPEQDVVASDRGARYDGILSFDPSWIIVIENKPSSHNIWEEQVHPNVPEVCEIEIDKVAVVLQWRNVIERLTTLVAAKVLAGAERMIVDDFLLFLDEQFSYLNPYDTFGKCKNLVPLLERRCGSILEAVAPGRVNWHPAWGMRGMHSILLNKPAAVERCGLYPDEDGTRIKVELCPGDTMLQGRRLFGNLRQQGVDGLIVLKERGLKIAPNFHFGFIQKGFGHGVKTRLSLEEYIRYWMEHLPEIEQVSLMEQTFVEALQEFVGSGMMDRGDVSKVVAALPAPMAPSFNVIPGIKMLFSWPLGKAVEIDRRGGMVEEFKRTVNEALVACGCEPFLLAEAAGA